MLRASVAALVAILLAGLAACGKDTTSLDAIGELGGGALTIRDNEVIVRRHGGPDAHVTADGTLSIGGAPVTTNDAQRGHLVTYYSSAKAIVTHAHATGKAGAEVGAAAAKEVLNGIVKGDTSQIGPKIEAKAELVKQAAYKICDDLASVLAEQRALNADLEAFRPYAVITTDDVNRCRKD